MFFICSCIYQMILWLTECLSCRIQRFALVLRHQNETRIQKYPVRWLLLQSSECSTDLLNVTMNSNRANQTGEFTGISKAKTKVSPESDYGVSSSPLLMREGVHRPDCVWVFGDKQLAAQLVPVADLCWPKLSGQSLPEKLLCPSLSPTLSR